MEALGFPFLLGDEPRLGLIRLAAKRQPLRPKAAVFVFENSEPKSSSRGGMGKWETCFWFSTFPGRLAPAVGMWESRCLCEISKGLWEEWEACFWLSTPSTVPPFPRPFSGPSNRIGAEMAIRFCRCAAACFWPPPCAWPMRCRSCAWRSCPTARSPNRASSTALLPAAISASRRV